MSRVVGCDQLAGIRIFLVNHRCGERRPRATANIVRGELVTPHRIPQVGEMIRISDLRNRKFLSVLALIALVATPSPLVYRWGVAKLNAYFLTRAQAAMDAEDFAAAESYAVRVLTRTSNQQASIIAGEAAMLLGRNNQAIKYFEPLLGGTGRDAVAAMAASADLYEKIGNTREAELLYRRVLAMDPAHAFAKHGLVDLLALQGAAARRCPTVSNC